MTDANVLECFAKGLEAIHERLRAASRRRTGKRQYLSAIILGHKTGVAEPEIVEFVCHPNLQPEMQCMA